MRAKHYQIWVGILSIFLLNTAFAEKIEIYGKAVDATTKKGIGAARVIVFPSGQRTETKANGNFHLVVEKKDGSFVQVLKEGYKSKKISHNITEIYAELQLSTQVEGQKVVVAGKRDKKKMVVSRQKLSNKMITQSSNTAFADSVKVVQTMPGVVTTSDFSALMYVRGGEVFEMMNYYDRVMMTDAYVWGGRMSVFNPNVVDSIDFYAGAFPAEYGNAMSGALDARMRDGNSKEFSGHAELSILSANFLFEGPIGEKGKTNDSFLVAVRRTHYDLAFKLMQEAGINNDKDMEGVTMPYFYDAHIRFKFQLDDKNLLKLFSLLVYEGSRVTFEATGDESTSEWKEGNEFNYKDFRGIFGVNLTSAFSKDFLMENTLSYSISASDYKYVDNYSPMSFEGTYQYFVYRNDITFKPNDRNIIKAGLGAYLYTMNIDMEMIVNKMPGDFIFDHNTGNTLDDPLTSVVEIADNKIPNETYTFNYENETFFLPIFYIQDDMELVKDTLYLNLGLRAEYFNISKRFSFDPRGGFKLNVDKNWTFKLAGGIYSQHIANGIWYDYNHGNPDLKPQKAYHGVLGLEWEDKNYFFRIDGYYKHYTDLVVEDYQKNFVNGGEGRAYGVDVYLQKKSIGKLDGWISYSFVVSQRRVTDRITPEAYNAQFTDESKWKGSYADYPENNKWYYTAFDRRHSLNLVLNYRFNKKWMLSTTTKLGTGLPYTPVKNGQVIHYQTPSGRNEYSPIWDTQNSGRLPFYFTMDAKLTMPFFWNNWSSYLQALNIPSAFGLKKVEQYYYNETYTKKRENVGFPFLIILGVKAKF